MLIQPEGYGGTEKNPTYFNGNKYWAEGGVLLMEKLQEEPMEDEDVLLRLTTEEALTLSTVLGNARSDCTFLGITGNFNAQTAARLLNSAIDPIISQLDEELAVLGVD